MDVPTTKDSRLEACATHGLKYDPVQYDGCTLCRRLEAPAEAAAPPAMGPLRLVIGLTMVAALGYFAFTLTRERVLARAESDFMMNDARARGAAHASATCRPAAEECFAQCPRASGNVEAECARSCLAELESCVEAYEP